MQSRTLRVISGGVAAGITIEFHPKHGMIDPADYPDKADLRRVTDPAGFGSKWLKSVSPDRQADLIQAVLEEERVSVDDPPGKYQLRLGEPVGVCNGRYVHSVEVRVSWGIAHGYPCEP